MSRYIESVTGRELSAHWVRHEVDTWGSEGAAELVETLTGAASADVEVVLGRHEGRPRLVELVLLFHGERFRWDVETGWVGDAPVFASSVRLVAALRRHLRALVAEYRRLERRASRRGAHLLAHDFAARSRGVEDAELALDTAVAEVAS